MRLPRPTHSGIIAYLALFIALSGSAFAANGGSFLLGKANKETRPATLNNSRGTTLHFQSPSGTAPFTVNRSVKVANLNADRLDGLDSSRFQRKLRVKVVTVLTSAYFGSVDCPSGWLAVSGGYHNTYVPSGETAVIDSDAPKYDFPDKPTGWSVWEQTDQLHAIQRDVYAVCIR